MHQVKIEHFDMGEMALYYDPLSYESLNLIMNFLNSLKFTLHTGFFFVFFWGGGGGGGGGALA